MDKNRLRLSVSAGDSSTATEEWLWYFAYCNFNTSGVKSFADDLAVRNGPVSSRVALLLRSAEGKPSFASISPVQVPRDGDALGVGLWRERERERERAGAARACLRARGCRVSQADLVKISSPGAYRRASSAGRAVV